MIPIGKKYSIDAVFALTKPRYMARYGKMPYMITVRPTHFSKSENYHVSEQTR